MNDHVLRSTDIGVERKVWKRGGEVERERVEENRSEGKRRDILYKYDRYLRKFTRNYF